jgi:glutamate 5-kinase
VGRRKSLLPAGITGVHGDFDSGDVVDLVGPDGTAVARGFVAHDAAELPSLIRRNLADLPPEQRRAVVHADDLVTLDRSARSPDPAGDGAVRHRNGGRQWSVS